MATECWIKFRALRDAFANLMHDKANSYGQMRQILLDHIRAGDGGFMALDDPRVVGFISKLKGQIGENVFTYHVGGAAALAESGSQEAWDVAVRQANGAFEYVQVKLYASPSDVVRQMLKVQDKIVNGCIHGCAGETVRQIDFAVPADIADRVNVLKDHFPQLDSLHVLTIPINADHAASIVKEGMNNVGPEQLSHFFHELLGGRSPRVHARNRERLPLVQGVKGVVGGIRRHCRKHRHQRGRNWHGSRR